MEDILASIKRVIADDGRAATIVPRTRRNGAAESRPSDEDVLELDDPVSDANGLMSDDAATASRSALAQLAAMRQPTAAVVEATGEGPLEAVVRDMLRPILKEWLDAHLPEIVEQLVTREIARITGKPL